MRISRFGRSIRIGQLWIGSKYDIHVILFVLCSYFGLQYYYFYYFSKDYFINSILNYISTFLFLYNYLNGTLREPGIVKKLQQIDEEDQRDEGSVRNTTRKLDAYFQERFCQTCRIMRPPKTSHCHMCNNCVKLYDHHCNFMGNCIGVRNYKYFIGWVYTLVLQCTIWYTVMISHFFLNINFTQLYEIIENSKEMQIITISLLLTICYFISCYFSRLGSCCMQIIIIAQIVGFIYYTFDVNKSYYDNFYCSLFFIILTIPGALFALSVSINQSFHLSMGINQKEWSVLEKQYNSQEFNSDSSIELQPQQQQQDVSTLNSELDSERQDLSNGQQQQFSQSIEDQMLREKIIKEFKDNENLKDVITPELVDAIFIQRKKYDQSLKYKQKVQETIYQHKSRATFQNYKNNLIRLFFQRIPESELD